MKYDGELTTDEGQSLIDDLAAFGIPSLLFSGGEPLMRKDLFTLIEYAAKKNIRPVISTNGTLIDRQTAQNIKDAGVVYVGISLDGMEDVNDKFRGVEGAFSRAMKGFENCAAVGQRVGLRLTLTRRNYTDLHRIFDFIEKEGINRACFYHLVYSGRGGDLFTGRSHPRRIARRHGHHHGRARTIISAAASTSTSSRSTTTPTACICT